MSLLKPLLGRAARFSVQGQGGRLLFSLCPTPGTWFSAHWRHFRLLSNSLPDRSSSLTEEYLPTTRPLHSLLSCEQFPNTESGEGKFAPTCITIGSRGNSCLLRSERSVAGMVTLAVPLLANSDTIGTIMLNRFVCVSNRRSVTSTVVEVVLKKKGGNRVGSQRTVTTLPLSRTGPPSVVSVTTPNPLFRGTAQSLR